LIKILLIFFIVTYGYAFRVESSYVVAHKKALKEDKILLVFLTKKSCLYCNSEFTKLLENVAIDKIIEKRAIFVIVMKNQKESYPIEMLFTREYPTLFFLDKHELFHCETLYGEMKVEKVLECIESKF